MINPTNKPFFCTLLCTGALLASLQLHALAEDENDEDHDQAIYASSGQKITPTAAPRSILQPLNPGLPDFPDFVASGGVSSVVSPDQKTLLVLTSGHNLLSNKNGNGVKADSEEYVFVYDISSGTPVEKQVLKVPNTFAGIAFNPNGQRFYAGGGVDDTIHTFTLQSDGSWAEVEAVIALGHHAGVGLQPSSEKPLTGGLDVTADGNSLVVANVYNDSVSVVDLNAHAVTGELDLRPGKIDPAQNGVPGGEYPFGVAIKGNNTAYISSLRDREVDVISFGGGQANLKTRIKIDGNPNKLILDRSQARLYVAADNSDDVSIVDTGSNQVIDKIHTVAPDWVLSKVRSYHGAAPNSLALSPDGRMLYVTNGGLNSVAVVRLDFNSPKVVGLVPTGFYPNAVSVSGDGSTLYVVNGKSVTGPNPGYFPKPTATNPSTTRAASNQYILELEKSSLLSFPVPDDWSLEQLTLTVAANNSLITRPHFKDAHVMKELREQIKHVIYIVKENRTYDQILGDLKRGNGDPKLVEFGEQTTPNCHRLALGFVDFDNFYDSGDVSANGWPWSTAARESDFGVKAVLLNYSGRGTDYEYEGTNRNVNVGLATVAERQAADPLTASDPNLLPGTGNVAAADGPGGAQKQKGYIWDAALRAGLSIRDYGFFADLTRYGVAPPNNIPLDRTPFATKTQVTYPTMPALIANFDPYFRGYDNAFPDYWREVEWEREFAQFEQNGNLPHLELVRFMHDHTGSFGTAIDGVNTVEIQQADNDYALGRLIDRVAHSRYKYDTLIFVVEDDAQDGADHVDARRSIAYVVGPYVKQGAVVSNRYTTVNMIRTIEDVLGLDHLNVYTATQRPMTAAFDLDQREWSYKAKPSALLANTQLPIPLSSFASYKSIPKPTHDAAYWAEVTKEFDFAVEDHLGDPAKFNRIVWRGLKGDVPYPSQRTGVDLRRNRNRLLHKLASADLTGANPTDGNK
jgi:YVTN family beta-propeller protein